MPPEKNASIWVFLCGDASRTFGIEIGIGETWDGRTRSRRKSRLRCACANKFNSFICACANELIRSSYSTTYSAQKRTREAAGFEPSTLSSRDDAYEIKRRSRPLDHHGPVQFLKSKQKLLLSDTFFSRCVWNPQKVSEIPKKCLKSKKKCSRVCEK